MPFELIVQHPFAERLPENRVRIRSAGEHIFDPAEMEAVKATSARFVVQVWVDTPTEAPKAPDPAADEAKRPSDPAPEHNAPETSAAH